MVSKEHQNKELAFISFQSKSLPLDSVKVAVLDDFYKVIGTLNLKLDDLGYLFIKNKEGKKEVVKYINVVL